MTADLAKKLQIKQGRSVRTIRAPAELSLGLPEGTTVRQRGVADVVLLFVKDADDLASRIADAVEATAPEGILWICYPKTKAAGGTDINRDDVWRLVEPLTGWRPVSQIAIDDRWSALRFRPRR